MISSLNFQVIDLFKLNDLNLCIPRVLHLEPVAADAAGHDEDEDEEGADDAYDLLQL